MTKLDKKIDYESDFEDFKYSQSNVDNTEFISNKSLNLNLENSSEKKNFTIQKNGLRISNEILAINDTSIPEISQNYLIYSLNNKNFSSDQNNFTIKSPEVNTEFKLNQQSEFLDGKNETELEEWQNSNATSTDSFTDLKQELKTMVKRETGSKEFKLKLAPGIQALGHFPFQLNKNHLTLPISNEPYFFNNINEPITFTESDSKTNIKFENNCMVSITVTSIITRTYSQISTNKECIIPDLKKQKSSNFY